MDKKYLNNIERIHPNPEEQKVDFRLRLHRAERLYPFSENFFNNFIKMINQQDIRCYPDVNILKNKLSKKFNIDKNNIFINNGSSETIRIFYEAFAINNKEIIITNPCYPMHKTYGLIHNSKLIEIKYNEKKTINHKHIIENINQNTCCIVLANPNSPIGDILDLNKIEEIIKIANNKNIPILIDEAYIEYTEQESCLKFLNIYENLVISRTFSKALGCAGLRIGYLLGNNKIMNIINKLVPTYEISALSVKFGAYLLDNYYEVDNYLILIKKEKKNVGELCKKYKIPHILNHINTIFLKPKNLKDIEIYLNNNKVLYRTRLLPYDNEPWLAIVLYPNFTNSEIFKNIINNNLKIIT